MNFGIYRDAFPDHFAKRKYIAEVDQKTKQALENGSSTEGYILREWKYPVCPKEKEWRGLVTIDEKNYHVYFLPENIYNEPYYRDFLAGWDFTSAISASIGIPPSTLVDNTKSYPLRCAENPGIYISSNGTYTLSIKFQSHDEDVVIMKEDDNITVLTIYGGKILSNTFSTTRFMVYICTLYDGNATKEIASKIFGYDFTDLPLMLGVGRVNYWPSFRGTCYTTLLRSWPTFITEDQIVKKLDETKEFFRGRTEEQII